MRLVPTARAELVGPGFSRIFELGEGGRFSQDEALDRAPRRLCLLRRLRRPLPHSHCSTRSTTSARTQRPPASACSTALLAKPDRSRNQGGAFEILSVEFFRDRVARRARATAAALDGTASPHQFQNGPVGALLRFNPSRRTGIRFDALYDTEVLPVLLNRRSRATLGVGSHEFARSSLGGAPQSRTGQDAPPPRTGLGSAWNLIPSKLRLNSMVSYNIEQRAAADSAPRILRLPRPAASVSAWRSPTSAPPCARTPSTGCWSRSRASAPSSTSLAARAKPCDRRHRWRRTQGGRAGGSGPAWTRGGRRTPAAWRTEVLAADRGRADLCDTDVEPPRSPHGSAPDAVYNCAAYTDVDGCESKPEIWPWRSTA